MYKVWAKLVLSFYRNSRQCSNTEELKELIGHAYHLIDTKLIQMLFKYMSRLFSMVLERGSKPISY